jgi:hypothetical protein
MVFLSSGSDASGLLCLQNECNLKLLMHFAVVSSNFSDTVV